MEKAKMVAIKSKLVGRPGETMEEQRVGKPSSAGGVLMKALIVAAVLAGVDSASGGRLLFVRTLRDVVARFRRG